MIGLSITLLGGFEVHRDGRPVTAFESDQVRALLAYLAAAPAPGRAHLRTTLAELLWPGHPAPAARANLRHALSRLRHALADRDPAGPLLQADARAIWLNPAAPLTVDVAAFEAEVAAWERHGHPGPEACPNCLPGLRAAAERYQGPLLADLLLSRSPLFEEWLLARREDLERRALLVFDSLARAAELAGAHAEARRLAERQLAIEPWREEAHAQLMRALAALGQRTAALAQYERCRDLLAAELGIGPSAELAALHARIRDSAPASRGPRLPAPPTPFVGRAAELAQLDGLLRGGGRLLTLTGPGGGGKTRLAIEAAARAADAFPDGVCFVDLAPVRSPGLLPARIAAAAGLPELPAQAPVAALAEHLARRRVLLVLDNFEQLLPAADAVGELLRAAPGATLLVTSRLATGAPGEVALAVPPLGLPEPGRLPPLDELGRYEGLRLFVLCAQAVAPGFAVDGATREVIVEICRRLDGLPLALELAAARLRLLSPAALLARLSRPLQLLSGGARGLPERQQTLRATIGWSYDLLAEPERALFRQLAVFVDGWTAEAAEAVCGGAGGELDALGGIEALLDNSLVQQVAPRRGAPGGEPRLRMLEVIRQYAAERLRDHGEADAAQRAHARYFLGLAARAAPELRGGRQAAWLAALDADYANLQAAFQWLAAEGQWGAALGLAVDLWYYWVRRERLIDGCAWLEAALAGAGEGDGALVARGLAALSDLLVRRGELARAEALCPRALGRFQALGDTFGEAFATLVLAHIANHRSDGARARTLYEASLAGFRRAGDLFWTAWALFDLAPVYRGHDLARAEAMLEESEALFRRLGAEFALVSVLTARGQAGVARGNLARAEAMLEESLRLCRRQGDQHAWQLLLLGEVVAARGDLARARALLAESLASYEETGVRKGVALAAAALGWAALAAGDGAQAAGLLERGRWLFTEVGDMWGVAWCLCGAGWLALAEGDPDGARGALARSLDLYGGLARTRGLAECLWGAAALAARGGRAHEAARLLGAAEGVVVPAEIPLPPPAPALMAAARGALAAALGEAALAAAVAEGRPLAPAAAAAAARAALL